MPIRLKRFVGMLLLIALVVVYSLVAIAIASYRLAESPWYVHLAFFGFAGIFWILPAMFIISWMERPARKPDAG